MGADDGDDALVRRLRGAGCVFAEEEAALLRERARDQRELEALCARREAGEFLEHVLGRVEIAGMRLAVGPGVFVPRRRTELLIGLVREELRRAGRGPGAPVVIEAYCGIAPVAAAAVRAGVGARVHAGDLSERALVHARANLGSGGAVHRADGLDGFPRALAGSVDVLAAVPPYVPTSAAAFLPHESAAHEPAGALFGGADGLDQVRLLLVEAPAWLRPGGTLLVELGADQVDGALREALGGWWADGDVVHAEGEAAGSVLRLRAPG